MKQSIHIIFCLLFILAVPVKSCLKNNELPACVDACPSGARVVGDIQDVNSDAAKLLKQHKNFVLQPGEGTKPNVYYIRKYSAR